MVSLVPADTRTKAADSVSLTQDGDTFILENNQVKAVVDGKGEVVSFVLKTSGREFAAEPMNRFHLYKDVPRLFDAWDIDSNYIDQEITAAEDVTVTVESTGSLRSVLKVTGQHKTGIRNCHRLERAASPVKGWLPCQRICRERDQRNAVRLCRAAYQTLQSI